MTDLHDATWRSDGLRPGDWMRGQAIERDRQLRRARRVRELGEHRWTWTRDVTNHLRMPSADYANAVGRSAERVRLHAYSYELELVAAAEILGVIGWRDALGDAEQVAGLKTFVRMHAAERHERLSDSRARPAA